MNTVWRRLQPYMTADDFLAWPGDGTGRTFQLVDGEVRPVSPASRIHGAVQALVGHLLTVALEQSNLDYQVMTEGAIQPALNADVNIRVPDLVVAPATDQRGDQVVPDPILIVEVLSPGNQDDTRDNVRAYATLPSVQEIVVLYSTRILAETHRRDASGAWLPNPEVVGADGRLRLETVGLDVRLADAYRRTYLSR